MSDAFFSTSFVTCDRILSRIVRTSSSGKPWNREEANRPGAA